MNDEEWMTLEEARAELGVCRLTIYKGLARPADHPLHLEGRKASNGYHWAGISRRSVAAYAAAREGFQVESSRRGGVANRAVHAARNGGRRERAAQSKRKRWTLAVPADSPRCPRCTALVGKEGDVCELCEAVGDGPYYRFRPVTVRAAVVWDEECRVHL